MISKSERRSSRQAKIISFMRWDPCDPPRTRSSGLSPTRLKIKDASSLLPVSISLRTKLPTCITFELLKPSVLGKDVNISSAKPAVTRFAYPGTDGYWQSSVPSFAEYEVGRKKEYSPESLRDPQGCFENYIQNIFNGRKNSSISSDLAGQHRAGPDSFIGQNEFCEFVFWSQVQELQVFCGHDAPEFPDEGHERHDVSSGSSSGKQDFHVRSFDTLSNNPMPISSQTRADPP